MPYRDHLTKEALKELDKYAADGLWNPDYVTYDAEGVKAVSCMRCGTEVMRRVYKETECPNCGHHFTVDTFTIAPMNNCTRFRHQVKNGSYVDLILCTDCLPLVQKEEANLAVRIDAQVAAGLAKEMVMAGKPGKTIAKQMDTFGTAIKEKR